jgi:hypothetical protein
MGTVKLLFSILGAFVIAACSIGRSSEPPMVVYHYESEQEFHHAAERADHYCAENYDFPAHTSDQWAGKGGDAAFSCAP